MDHGCLYNYYHHYYYNEFMCMVISLWRWGSRYHTALIRVRCLLQLISFLCPVAFLTQKQSCLSFVARQRCPTVRHSSLCSVIRQAAAATSVSAGVFYCTLFVCLQVLLLFKQSTSSVLFVCFFIMLSFWLSVAVFFSVSPSLPHPPVNV